MRVVTLQLIFFFPLNSRELRDAQEAGAAR